MHKIKYNKLKLSGTNGEDSKLFLNSWSTLSTQFKMRDSYKDHDIIIRDGFDHGVYSNISCREWNVLRSKE